MTSIAIQGIQYDEKSSFLKGPAQAPPMIREAFYSDSSNLFSEDLRDLSLLSINQAGDFKNISYTEIESTTEKSLAQGDKLLTLGGDHSITFPIVRALHKKHPDIDILHIDAHADLYHEFEGDPYSHACPFARIMEGRYAKRLVQVGIRTLNTHQKEQAEKYNVEVHEMRDFDQSKIPSFQNPLYISLDMDAFDPGFAPGVSHYEPGGLSPRQVIDLIQSIDAEIIGADVVEYNPTRDINNITAYLAAKMMKEFLAKMAS